MRMTLSEILSATGAVGDLGESENPVVTEARTDSRSATPGCLFVCVPGERFDGHHFAAEALRKGAAAILADRPMPELTGGAPVLLVRDTVAALGRLALAWRRKVGATVAAVSGSAGKTTVKEMLAAILSEKAHAAKNHKNFNNCIGLPLSMLAAEAGDAYWVMELGISLPGEMERLAEIAEPDLAVVHNVGPAHLEGLGDLTGVARAKCELFRHLRRGGRALAGMDYPELWREARQACPLVMGMSRVDPEAMFFGRYLGRTPEGQGRFALNLAGTAFETVLPFVGGHMAENVLAAASAAHLLGCSAAMIEAGLRKTEIPDQRFCVRRQGAFTVIDDTYNANPLSMRRSIEAAKEEAGDGPLVLVLGEMRELGREAASEHEALGRFVAGVGCAAVFFSGEAGAAVAAGLAAGGYDGAFARTAKAEEFLQGFRSLNLSGGTLLFKGSRSLRMEEYLQAFAAAENRGAAA